MNIQPPNKKRHGCLFYGLIVVGAILSLFVFTAIISGFIQGFKEGIKDSNIAATAENSSNSNGDTNKSDEKAIVTPEPTLPPTPTINPYIQITSTDLIAAYKDNQVNCKQLYDNQLLEVTGKVQSVGTDIMDNTYVCLGSDDEYTFVGIQCYVKNEDEINKIAQLKEGDVITVKGKGDCGSLSFSIEKAEIIE
jgi:hypothetical protein